MSSSNAKFQKCVIFELFVINKAGGLILHQDFVPNNNARGGNDHLRLASTFHGLHSMSTMLSPLAKLGSGITCIEAGSFVLQNYETLTGIKFMLTASPESQDLESLLHSIYQLYTEYVLKNPFYVVDMPIRCSLFDLHLSQLVKDRMNPSKDNKQ